LYQHTKKAKIVKSNVMIEAQILTSQLVYVSFNSYYHFVYLCKNKKSLEKNIFPSSLRSSI